MPNKRIDFSDINLIPRKCVVESRSECSTLTMLGTHTFELPIVPANMECVINDEIAERLAASGFFYIHDINSSMVNMYFCIFLLLAT